MSILPLTLDKICVRRRGDRLIGPVSCVISEAGFTIVLGPNGSGKTSLLRAMHGIERLSEGHLRWAQPIEIAEKNQAFVFQSPIMLRRTVRQNLVYPLALVKMDKTTANEQAEHWASRIGLTKRLDQAAPRLSGGEKQKLALARALIRKPEVLFLDEPCANLDGRATREIEDILKEAQAAGTRIIMATHDMGQARRLATEVFFMLRGCLHETGPASTVFDSPKTQEIVGFLRGDIVE